MSTSGSYTPAAVPECPYAPRMTRAAALALAAGGGLVENCVVVLHTDTPTIGTAGNTSVTEIELNPVSPTAFGQTARVFTTFAAEAWPGVYDLAANKITELRDGFGNVAKDIDAGSATVHTQVPWHLGSATLFRDNVFEDATLTGFATAVGAFTNNIVKESTLNFTGKSAGTVNSNTWVGVTTFISGAVSLTMSRSRFHGGGLSNLGTGPVTLTAVEVDNAGPTANIQLLAGDTEGFTGFSSKFLGSYRIVSNRTGAGPIPCTSMLFLGGSADPVGDMRFGVNGAMTGNVFLTSSTVTARNGGGPNSQFIVDGPGQFAIQQSTVGQNDALSGPGVLRDPASVGSTAIQDALVNTIRVVQGAGAGTLTIGVGSKTARGFINMLGSGPVTISGTSSNALNVTTAVGSTRGVQVIDAVVSDSTITQNGTGNANLDVFGQGGSGCILHRATINLNNTLAGEASQTYQGIEITSGGTLTVANPGNANPVNNSKIDTQAVVNLLAGGSFSRSRASNEAIVNTAFSTLGSIVEGQFTKTSTAANVNRLVSKAFDDWL